MTITVYTSADAGAPSLSGTRFIDRLKIILQACLVNGYGSKPAAGWVTGHDVADGFSVGNGEGFINFVNYNTNNLTVYIMETITDGTTALAGGYNRRSSQWYDGQSTTARQYYFHSGIINDAYKQWIVVADDKTCYLMIDSASSSTIGTGSATSFNTGFGRISTIAGSTFASFGGTVSSGNAGYFGVGFTAKCSLLRNPITGNVDQGTDYTYAVCPASSVVIGVCTTKLIAIPTTTLQFIRQPVYGSGTSISATTNTQSSLSVGRLRGILSCIELSTAYASQLLPLFSLADQISSYLNIITLPNGKQVLIISRGAQEGGAQFISLDLADWT